MIRLSRDSWHRKLVEFTWNNTKDFNNLCPYWWMLVASILVLPLTLLGFLINKTPLKPLVASEQYNYEKGWYTKPYPMIGVTSTLIALTLTTGAFLLVALVAGTYQSFGALGLGALIGLPILITSIILARDTEALKIIFGMVISVYKKICPLIEWK